MSKYITLANIIYPNDLCKNEDLYFKVRNLAYYNKKENIFYLEPNSEVIYDTYYNSFSIGKWLEYTNISDLYLLIKAKGKYILTIYQIDDEHNIEVLSRQLVNNDDISNEYIVPINQFKKEGIIYFSLHAIEKTKIYSIKWVTDKKSEKKIKLGISITTFNRQKAVKKTIQRILNFLNLNKDLNIKLIVVDNGKNLDLNHKSDDKFIIIPNENLGGSGGFARGLYYLKEENKDFTHALFMDDDASCEMESIYRTYRFLEFAKKENLAIAGALTMENDCKLLWEKGASFYLHVHANKKELVLNNIQALLISENQLERIDFGGWWYFAFPVKFATYPYPFFVRGDDIDFGLHNNFQIVTLNGISSIGDDFTYKESPFTRYLNIRSHFLQHINHHKKLKFDITIIFKLFLQVMNNALTLKYASAEAQIEALKDVLKGPEFFEKNINMKEIFPKLKPLNEEERLKPLNLKEYLNKNYILGPDICTNKFIKAITLNSHLIPKVFFKKRSAVLWKSDNRIGAYFRRKKVLIYHPKTKSGFLLKHNKKRFFKILFDAISLQIKFLMNKNRLIKEYNDKYDYLTSKEYWEKQFFKDEK